ncbi:MAG: erythromycin esterase family protein [Pseudobdellovibrio sp.]
MIFSNRHSAGQLLAEKLQEYKELKPIILALPRGGVPVAAEIADQLDASLEVLIVRKIGPPFQAELGVGAICEDEEPIWNMRTLSRVGLEPDDLSGTVQAEKGKIRKQIISFREGRNFPSIEGRNVIVVDDGLATGVTALAAIKYLKSKGVAKLIVAVPVAATISAQQIREKGCDLVALEERIDLTSVGQWYEDFTQVTDEEVISLLKKTQKKEILKKVTKNVEIPVDANIKLTGDLTIFPFMKALIIFAHGSGSSRKSPRNQTVAAQLNDAGFGTLLFDLLSDQEALNRKNVFDIDFLSERLIAASRWLRQQIGLENIEQGYFGASTGSGAAIKAASKLSESESVFAIVSRGGRPDLASHALEVVKAPTLLLVGGQDYDVIVLNRQADKLLSHSKLVIIPGATHLFEEPGALEEVSKQAIEWFKEQIELIKPEIKPSKRLSIEEAIDNTMIPMRTEDDIDRLIQSFKDTRVVMLGESSHGTHEYYQMRSLISQRLIKDYGFKFIAVEGDWPDAYRLNKYIQTGEGGNAKNVLMKNHRWPTWMWANDEVADLAEWMRTQKAGFYGLDVYSLFDSIVEVKKFLKENNPELSTEIEKQYACFDRFEGDEIAYARSLLMHSPGCEKEVILSLQKIMELQVNNNTKNADELFSAQQNAWIVANAETYYRVMLGADSSSWNVRDSHMIDTLDRLLEQAGEGAKGIVWAHNTHIGDYRATDMQASGYVNLGGLARQSYGEENVALVGFGTYKGEVLAATGWGKPEQIMQLSPAKENSYEHYFHKAAEKHKLKQFYMLLENKTHSPFARKLGHRAVGVVYNPLQDSRGNYVPSELSKRYDAFFFIDETHALKSLHSYFVRGEVPETWPSGQ